MRACERKFGRAVIERGSVPRRRRMALDAIRGKSGGLMIRVRRGSIVRTVALIAGCIRQLIIVVDVAHLALDRMMKSGQREFCCRMIER